MSFCLRLKHGAIVCFTEPRASHWPVLAQLAQNYHWFHLLPEAFSFILPHRTTRTLTLLARRPESSIGCGSVPNLIIGVRHKIIVDQSTIKPCQSGDLLDNHRQFRHQPFIVRNNAPTNVNHNQGIGGIQHVIPLKNILNGLGTAVHSHVH